MIVERYIDGREFSCFLLPKGKVVGMAEYRFHPKAEAKFLTYRMKSENWVEACGSDEWYVNVPREEEPELFDRIS